mgnify:CR=1 FL=1
MIKVLIVDDEKPICDLIDLNLSAAGYHTKAVQDGLTAIEMIEKEDFDLVLLDIMLPGADGYDVMEYIRPLGVPVIFITAKHEVRDRVKGLKLGADDYLAKPFGMMEMVSRIRAVLRRTAVPAKEKKIRLGQLEMDPMAHIVCAQGQRIELTLKEFDLLRLFMEHPGRVFSRDQLLERIWSMDYVGETRTVDVHIGTLRTKLGPCGDFIRTVRGVGYRMEENQ